MADQINLKRMQLPVHDMPFSATQHGAVSTCHGITEGHCDPGGLALEAGGGDHDVVPSCGTHPYTLLSDDTGIKWPTLNASR